MVCREIMSCPVVSMLRGDLGILRVVFCETGSEKCRRERLAPLLRGLQDTLLPDGTIYCQDAPRLSTLQLEHQLG